MARQKPPAGQMGLFDRPKKPTSKTAKPKQTEVRVRAHTRSMPGRKRK